MQLIQIIIKSFYLNTRKYHALIIKRGWVVFACVSNWPLFTLELMLIILLLLLFVIAKFGSIALLKRFLVILWLWLELFNLAWYQLLW